MIQSKNSQPNSWLRRWPPPPQDDPSRSAPPVAESSKNANGHLFHLRARAYLQIIDVSWILGLDCDITDHAFQLFRDCSSATCLRNRSVEVLATVALVQAIREAQEPRTLQPIYPRRLVNTSRY